ncbi:hypothetical protein NliqN6_0194 [Naganishia liquefaciens]|uniref:Uncharacterized protein n=1 Tax=Naganishia liquefaciens TaxID=104408 RepID=A0A8H3TMF4_9TREE|nr:hypothetical protein NliqN6_0194 [Naganishia liquefaciens]
MSPVFWNEIRLFDGTLKTCDAQDSSEPPPPSSLKVQAYETFPEVGEKRLADITLNFDKTEDLIFHDEQPQVPIWPAVVDKFMKTYRQTDNRLLDTDGKLYDCGNDHSEVERRQMCRYATILTRITGKRFQSTTRIIDKNKKLNDKYLFSLVNKYTHGLTYVMTDNALTHIVKSSKDEHNFHAVTVDHQNIGPLKEHGVAFKSIKPLSESLKGQVVPFKEIRAKENGKVSREQDIHIIHFHEKSLPIAKSTTMPQSSPTQ